MKKLTISLLVMALLPLCLFSQEHSFKWLRSVTFQSVRPYHEAFSAYYQNGKWGFLDINGNPSIPAIYEDVADFNLGLAAVKNNGKWGVIDLFGNIVFECVYDSIEPFSDGFALATQNGQSYYLMSMNSKRMELSPKYTFTSFHDGVAWAKDSKGRWGLINKNFNFEIDPTYSEVTDFHGGYAFVTKGKNRFLINKKGSKVTTPYNSPEELHPQDNGTAFMMKNGTYSLLLRHENSIGSYTEFRPFSENLAMVRSAYSGTFGFVNQFGQFLTVGECEALGDFSNGMAWIKKDGKYGYINTKAEIIIPAIFSYASNFDNGIAYVAIDGREGVIRLSTKDDLFPEMVIDNIVLADSDSNKRVDAQEKFKIIATVTNHGTDTLKGAVIRLLGNSSQSSWFKYDSSEVYAGDISAGESKTVEFNGETSIDIVSQNVIINLTGIANNLMNPTSSQLQFPIMGVNACKPIISSYFVHTKNHTALTPGEEAFLDITVENEGSDIAKDVILTLKWPEGINAKEEKLKISSIAPNESRKVSASFFVLDSLDYNKFSVVAAISEFTKRHDQIEYLTFYSGEMNPAVNLRNGIVIASAQPSIQHKSTKSELLVGLSPVVQEDVNKFALIIGNEDYNTQKTGTSYQSDVPFAERDAKTFKEYAVNILGVPASNIIMITNATYGQMRSDIDKITRVISNDNSNRELYVYYAGHSQIDPDTKESYLIPVDIPLTSPTQGIRLQDFYAKLSDCHAKRAIVFLDACYTGQGRGIVISAKKTPVNGNLLVMSSSSATQRSMPLYDKSHGLFTYYLLSALKESQGDITVAKLFEKVKKNVSDQSILLNSEQTPELINGSDIAVNWQNWKL